MEIIQPNGTDTKLQTLYNIMKHNETYTTL